MKSTFRKLVSVGIVLIILFILFLASVQLGTSSESVEDIVGLSSDLTPQYIGPTGGKFIAPIEPLTDAMIKAEGYIKISDRAGLEAIKNNLNGKYYLSKDIYLSGAEWIPIGDYTNYFRGTFDGQGYVIHNLAITGDHKYAGLFGYVENANITNTGLEETKITISYSSTYDSGSSSFYRSYVGGVCGYTSSVISNCYNTGDISASSIYSYYSSYVGGVCGYASGSTSGISNCYNVGDISGSASFSNTAYYANYVGGICGFVRTDVLISNCYWRIESAQIVNGRPQVPKKGVGSGTGTTTGLTSADMMHESSYAGWDFETIWATNFNINEGYPYLRGLIGEKPLTFVVSYDVNGGSGAPGSVSYEQGATVTMSSVVPELFGYTFVGWLYNGVTYEAGETFTMPANDVTLVAQWTEDPVPTFVVSYDANGGSGAPGNVLYEQGTTVIVSNVIPTRSGYSFNGWLYNGITYTGDQTFMMPAVDVTLTAQWTQNSPATYTITYNANSGTGAPTSSQQAQGTTVTVSSGVPTRSGYTFNGWLYNGNTYTAGQTFTMPANNIELVAQWIQDTPTYTVIYNANGGSGVPTDNNRYALGATVTVSNTVPTRSGYTFNGWSYIAV